MRFELRRVQFIPKVLEPGVLYVAEQFGAAAHLCPCGCLAKVRTPLGPVDWLLNDGPHGPTLFPSIGNWQQPCRSHYWICNGAVVWAEAWTEEQIAAGRAREQLRAEHYFATRSGPRSRSKMHRLWNLVGKLLDRIVWR
jgi:hypothetical protein